MSTKHQINASDLIDITMGYEHGSPVTFSEFVNTFIHGPKHLGASTITNEDGVRNADLDITAAGVFLRALEKAGYVIVTKQPILQPLTQPEHPEYQTIQ